MPYSYANANFGVDPAALGKIQGVGGAPVGYNPAPQAAVAPPASYQGQVAAPTVGMPQQIPLPQMAGASPGGALGGLTGALGTVQNVAGGIGGAANAITSALGLGGDRSYSGTQSDQTSDQKAQSQNQMGTSTSQYLIPGAQANYQSMADMTRGDYGGAMDLLGQGYKDLSQQTVNGYGNLYNQAEAQTEGLGKAEQQQLENQYAQAGAQQQQGLINRGLGNTTVQNAVDQGLTGSKALAQQNLNQQIANQKLGVLQQFGAPVVAAGQNIGQNQINQRLATQLAGAQAQQGYGTQYLGQVGQQGVQTTNQQQGTVSQAQDLQNKLMNQSGIKAAGDTGGVGVGGSGGSGGVLGLIQGLGGLAELFGGS